MQILEGLLMQSVYDRVIYVGDGRNDFCPCTRLGPSDHILARTEVWSPCVLE
jgi:hypothetical protein